MKDYNADSFAVAVKHNKKMTEKMTITAWISFAVAIQKNDKS